jgi:hypothetical protein
MDTTLQHIEQIAHEIREKLICKLDKEYDSCFCKDLTGFCAIASSMLFVECIKRGYDVKIRYNHNHVFLTYKHYVIDITATQFDRKFNNVEIRRLREMRQLKTTKPYWHKTYWDIKKTFLSVQDLQAHLVKEKWPHEQIPVL